MDYYKMKRRAFVDIQTWIGEGHNLNYMEGALLRKYGFGYKALMKYLERLENEGKIEVDGENVRVIK